MRTVTPVAERLARRSQAAAGGCILWTGNTSNCGYGLITIQTEDGPKSRSVHRVAYELERGPIAGALTVDHLCRVKLCINTAHMELVTRSENVMRRDGASRDECRNGHAYTPENTRIRGDWRGVRICRACEAEATRRYRARKAAQA